MRSLLLTLILTAVLSMVGCGGSGGGGMTGDGGPPQQEDTDGDFISDADEGAREGRDTDGDGIPDFRDDDSDGDGIPDSLEAGDMDTNTPPVDHDMDTVPDYLDLDSDDNGIPDATEGTGDNDGDGIGDWADTDDDNDRIEDREEVLEPTAPSDADGDGIPDFRDPDSDNDNILDGDERPRTGEPTDTDGDGLPDWVDLDSDNDGFSDAMEAGDSDIRTFPVDTDGDTIPDFRDTDSDNDGLSDRDEASIGSDPRLGDSDMDGVSDLIEFGAGTDATDPTDSPRTRGDFVFIVDYMVPPDPTRDTLRFRTSIQFADIYFLFDQSGSMSGEINGLRSAVGTILGNLTCRDFGTACARDSDCAGGQVCSLEGTCIEDPGMSSCVASPWSGSGHYENGLGNNVSIQPDPTITQMGINTSTYGGTEIMNGAVVSLMNGVGGGPPTAPPGGIPLDEGPTGSPTGTNSCAAPAAGTVGCPGFRDSAVKILVLFTDEDSDGTPTTAEAAMALNDRGVTFIGIWSGAAGSAQRADMDALAMASGSVDRMGMPLVYEGTDAAVVPPVTAAINEIVEGIPLRVTIGATDEPDDDGDALQFIDYLETNTTGMGCTPVRTEDSDGDGRQDSYPSVTPGTPVCFDVVPRQNDTVMPDVSPLVFRARLTIFGDGSPLDSRIVYFLIPPDIPEVPIM